MCLLLLRPNGSRSPQMMSSIGSRNLTSLLPLIRATRLQTLSLVGQFSPTELASTRWTHNRTSTSTHTAFALNVWRQNMRWDCDRIRMQDARRRNPQDEKEVEPLPTHMTAMVSIPSATVDEADARRSPTEASYPEQLANPPRVSRIARMTTLVLPQKLREKLGVLVALLLFRSILGTSGRSLKGVR